MARINAGGLFELAIGDIPVSGSYQDVTVWTTISDNLEGSVSLAQEDVTNTDIKTEEADTIYRRIKEKGASSFTSEILNINSELVTMLTGAVVTDNAGQKVISMPNDAQYINKCVKIVTKLTNTTTGALKPTFYFNNGDIEASMPNGELSKTGMLSVKLSIGAMIPAVDGIAAVEIETGEATA